MHQVGFDVIAKKKGTFIDGHKRDNVVAYTGINLYSEWLVLVL